MLLESEFGRPVTFMFEDGHELLAVQDETSFKSCLEFVRKKYEKSTSSKGNLAVLEVFILDRQKLFRQSKRKIVNKAEEKKTFSNDPLYGDTDPSRVRHSTGGLDSAARKERVNRQHIRSSSGNPKLSWNFEERHRQIDALIRQQNGHLESKENLHCAKAKSQVPHVAGRQIHASDAQAVDLAENQVRLP